MYVEYGKREDQPSQHDQIGAEDQRQSSEVPERGVIACVGQPACHQAHSAQQGHAYRLQSGVLGIVDGCGHEPDESYRSDDDARAQ